MLLIPDRVYAGLAVSPAALGVDLPVMIAAALACLPIFFSDYRISRPEGILFLFYYLGGMTLFFFIVQVVTGILLMLYYP